MSSRMISGSSLSASSSSVVPLSATMTSKYSLDSLASSSLTFNSTSSTTRTRAVIGLCRYLREKALDRTHEAGDRHRLCIICFASVVAELLLVALQRTADHSDERSRQTPI